MAYGGLMDFKQNNSNNNLVQSGLLHFLRISSAVVMLACILSVTPSSSEASWLIYHKPEFKGKILDTENKEPIEGAVVVVKYMKYPLIGGPGGKSATILNIREALTDKEGTFRIPSYTTLIPFSLGYKAVFIVYKPGYASITDLDLEEVYSKDSDKEEVEIPWLHNQDIKFRFAPRRVALPRVKTKEERMWAKPAPVGEPSDWKSQKQLIKTIREEWKYLYNEDPGNLYK